MLEEMVQGRVFPDEVCRIVRKVLPYSCQVEGRDYLYVLVPVGREDRAIASPDVFRRVIVDEPVHPCVALGQHG